MLIVKLLNSYNLVKNLVAETNQTQAIKWT